MPNDSELARFLQAIFPDHEKHGIFATEHKSIPDSWKEFREVEKLDDTRDCYLSNGILPDDGIAKREGRIQSVWALVIDDIGTTGPTEAAVERALGPFTAEILSSKGNAQWWYVLKERMPAKDWPVFFAEVERLIGMDLEGEEAGHVFRIPMGLNTKIKRKRKEIPVEERNFRVRLGRQDFAARLDAAGIMLFAEPVLKREPSSTATGHLGINALQELMVLVPNTYDDRKEWIRIGHGLKALCKDDAEGFQVFDEWSQTWGDGYDAAETKAAWKSFGRSGLVTKGGKLKARAEALNREKFIQWKAKEVFDDEDKEWPKPRPKPKKPLFEWVDHRSMPTRDWLYGRLLIRKFITMTVAPGGLGKSSLIVTEALAQVTGRNLIGEKVKRPLRVWMWNLEDPREEVQRRILAAAKHHNISEADIGDRLLVSGGRDQRLVIADMVNRQPTIIRSVIDGLIERIKAYAVDVLIIDPFVSCHKLPENDNIAQDMVIKEFNQVAEEGNCAIHLIDHTRKAPAGTEVDTQSARGAKSKTDAARVVRVINRMTDAEGKNIYGKSEPWKFIHAFHDKSNMAPPLSRREWFQLISVSLENGGIQPGVGAGINPADEVGVIDEWNPPSPTEMASAENFQQVVKAMEGKRWRDSDKSPNWIGEAVFASVDPERKYTRKAIKDLIKVWMEEGLMQISPEFDDNRIMRDFIVLGGKRKTVY